MKVAYIQPIFSPNKVMFDRNLKSIMSFISYYFKNEYNFKCIFGGYCPDDDMFNTLETTIRKHIGNSIVVRFDKNYGKAYIVNELSRYLEDEAYFLTADSDICYHYDEANIIDRLSEMANLSNLPAIIGLNQLENNCHLMELLHQNIIRYGGKYGNETICWPNIPAGMAGGCIFVRTSFWKLVGGYKVLGVYAADDATLLTECHRFKDRFIFANSINCIHPNEDDESYQRWKIENASKVQLLENAIDNANSFWGK